MKKHKEQPKETMLDVLRTFDAVEMAEVLITMAVKIAESKEYYDTDTLAKILNMTPEDADKAIKAMQVEDVMTSVTSMTSKENT